MNPVPQVVRTGRRSLQPALFMGSQQRGSSRTVFCTAAKYALTASSAEPGFSSIKHGYLRQNGGGGNPALAGLGLVTLIDPRQRF